MNEQQLQDLILDVRRLQDVNMIQNMISTTSYMFAIGEYSTIFSFFSRRDDITAEIASSGRRIGRQAVQELFVDTWQEYADRNAAKLHERFPSDPVGENRNGLLDLRALASPIIEVAKDRQTAKGLWMIPGTQTFTDGTTELPVAYWVWTKLALDLVPEDGKWRIWHMVSVPCFATSYDRSWVETSLSDTADTLTLSNPYSIHGTYPHPPRPPKPYDTFADTFSY